MNQIDLVIFRWLNSFAGVNFLYDWLIIFFATYFLYIMIASVFLFYSADRNFIRVKWAVIHSFAAGIFSRFVFTEIIRSFYNSPRPFAFLHGVTQLIEEVPGHSLPSGHAAFSFAFAMAIYYYYPKTSILFFAGAVLMGMARVAAGVHWPSDILAGAVVGIFTAWLIKLIFRKFATSFD